MGPNSTNLNSGSPSPPPPSPPTPPVCHIFQSRQGLTSDERLSTSPDAPRCGDGPQPPTPVNKAPPLPVLGRQRSSRQLPGCASASEERLPSMTASTELRSLSLLHSPGQTKSAEPSQEESLIYLRVCKCCGGVRDFEPPRRARVPREDFSLRTAGCGACERPSIGYEPRASVAWRGAHQGPSLDEVRGRFDRIKGRYYETLQRLAFR